MQVCNDDSGGGGGGGGVILDGFWQGPRSRAEERLTSTSC